jgi:hypothetical protein
VGLGVGYGVEVGKRVAVAVPVAVGVQVGGKVAVGAWGSYAAPTTAGVAVGSTALPAGGGKGLMGSWGLTKIRRYPPPTKTVIITKKAVRTSAQ